jgi:hypothetical protein
MDKWGQINGVRDEFPYMDAWICAGSVRKFVSDPIYPDPIYPRL